MQKIVNHAATAEAQANDDHRLISAMILEIVNAGQPRMRRQELQELRKLQARIADVSADCGRVCQQAITIRSS